MNHPHTGAQPRFLTVIKGTLTPIYVLKLSSDPSITTVPGPPGFPSDPYAITSVSAAHTHRVRHAVHIPNVPNYGFAPFHVSPGFGRVTTLPVSVSPNTAESGVGRRKAVAFQRPFQPRQPELSGTQLRQNASTWRVDARDFSQCVAVVGGLP